MGWRCGRCPRSRLFDFELSADEMAAIDGLVTGRRGGPSLHARAPDATGEQRSSPRHPLGPTVGSPVTITSPFMRSLWFVQM